MQGARQAVRDVIHDRLGYVARGIAAEESEHARAAEVGGQVRLAGDDVKVNVLEPLSLGEERDVSFAAAEYLAQRGCESAEQRAELGGFLRRQLVQSGDVAAWQDDQPARQRGPEGMRNPPPLADVHPLSRRQIGAGVICTSQAFAVRRHNEHYASGIMPA